MAVACRYGFTDQKNFPKIYHSEFARDADSILQHHTVETQTRFQ